MGAQISELWLLKGRLTLGENTIVSHGSCGCSELGTSDGCDNGLVMEFRRSAKSYCHRRQLTSPNNDVPNASNASPSSSTLAGAFTSGQLRLLKQFRVTDVILTQYITSDNMIPFSQQRPCF